MDPNSIGINQGQRPLTTLIMFQETESHLRCEVNSKSKSEQPV